jgi:hypothetical protein
VHKLYTLTAFVLSSHESDDKKYVAPGRRITDGLKEEKRSRYFIRTLLIKDFKYGSSLSILVGKNKEAQRSQVSQIFLTIITRQLGSIPARNNDIAWE